ncbi:HAD hydrolase family protein, partial [Ruminococcaceae bacterium OttesenSCG-928-A16]|nr:HAD hydrolase family protein [Ruminococcaceae bacterium OttesenSCG-928-A16]
MIKSLADILVFSDMDGTLLTDDMQLSSANLETIRLFTMLGGRFS